MSAESRPPLPGDPQLPPRLAEDLGRLYTRRVEVPASLDQAILDQARRQIARRQDAPRPVERSAVLRRLLPWAGGLAAAAALALGVFVGVPHLRDRGSPRPLAVAPGVPEPSGPVATPPAAGQTVTVLDAFALARMLQARITPAAGWDINADGRIDGGDVEALARRAVRLTAANHARLEVEPAGRLLDPFAVAAQAGEPDVAALLSVPLPEGRSTQSQALLGPDEGGPG